MTVKLLSLLKNNNRIVDPKNNTYRATENRLQKQRKTVVATRHTIQKKSTNLAAGVNPNGYTPNDLDEESQLVEMLARQYANAIAKDVVRKKNQ